jgi:hypothetical protein
VKGRLIRLVLVAAAAAVWVAVHTGAAVACGEERWNVKTLQDAAAGAVNFTPKTTTVDTLRHLPVPVAHVGPHMPRLAGSERQTFKVTAQLVKMKLEEDGDVHLVIAALRRRSHTMIVRQRPHESVQSVAKRLETWALSHADSKGRVRRKPAWEERSRYTRIAAANPRNSLVKNAHGECCDEREITSLARPDGPPGRVRFGWAFRSR